MLSESVERLDLLEPIVAVVSHLKLTESMKLILYCGEDETLLRTGDAECCFIADCARID